MQDLNSSNIFELLKHIVRTHAYETNKIENEEPSLCIPVSSSVNISHCKASVETYYQYHGNKEKSSSLTRENFG